jgi:hypothetical protein
MTMARELDTTDVVWLATLRGASLEDTWQEALREGGHPVKRNYVAHLRAEANRLIRERFHSLHRMRSNLHIRRFAPDANRQTWDVVVIDDGSGQEVIRVQIPGGTQAESERIRDELTALILDLQTS